MGERPRRKPFNLFKALKFCYKKDKDKVENIMSGVGPWSGPSSKNTSQGSLTEAQTRRNDDSRPATPAVCTGPQLCGGIASDDMIHPQLSHTRLSPVQSHSGGGQTETLEDINHTSQSQNSNHLAEAETSQTPSVRRIRKSFSRYRLPRGHKMKLDAENQSSGIGTQDKSLGGSSSVSTVFDQSDSTRGNIFGRRAIRSVSQFVFGQHTTSWSHFPHSQSMSWDQIERSRSDTNWKPRQKESHRFSFASTNYYNWYNSSSCSQRLSKRDLETPRDIMHKLEEAARELSREEYKNWPTVVEEKIEIEEEEPHEPANWKIILLDIFIIISCIVIFIWWYSSQWNHDKNPNLEVSSEPVTQASCQSCGQSIKNSPDCEACDKAYSPAKTILQHFRIFTDAFSRLR